MGLPGQYVAPNITPFNLKDWSDGEIYRAITSGVSKDGRPLFPIMPYLNYGQMQDEDIYSVIAYLRTLPEIQNSPPPSESDFPVNIIIHTLPQESMKLVKPDPTDIVNYGKYLTTAAGCADCHTPMVDGALVEGMEFAGGQEFPMSFGTLISPNLTPDVESGIGIWTKKNFLDRFKSYERDSYEPEDVSPSDYNTIMPWTMYANMDTTDIEAIYAYLRSIPPKNHKVGRAEYAK